MNVHMPVRENAGKKNNKSRILDKIAIIVFVVSLLAVVAIEIQLNNSTEYMRNRRTNITHLESHLEHINAVEWMALAEENFGPETEAEIAKTRDEINAILANLANSEEQQQIRNLYNDYIAASEEEFKLLVQGKKEEAMKVDRERVDPAFKTLLSTVQETNEEISAAIESGIWMSYRNSAFTIVLAVMVVLILLWKFNQSRRAEEQINAVNFELQKANMLQKQAEGILLQWMQLEKLITSLSTQFINCTLQEIDAQINYSLQLVGEFTGVDRCYTFLLTDDGETMNNTHEWCAPGVESQIEGRKNILVDSIPWFKEQTRDLGFIYIPDVSDLGPEAKAERGILTNRQIRSHLLVPVIYEKTLKGFLGFDTVQEKKVWSREDISSLGIVGEIIATALMRRKSEELLFASEERFRATFEQAAVGVVHADLDGRWLLVNQKFCDMVGYTKEEAVKLSFGDITHPDDLGNDLEHVARLQSGEITVFSIDKRYLRKDGSLVWVNLTVSLVRESSGEPMYYIGVIQDITDRKHAENLIQEQKEFSENLLQNLTVPAFVLSPEHKVLIWNKACEHLTGLRENEIIDTDLHWKGFYDHKRPCIADIIIDANAEKLPTLYTSYGTSNIISDGLSAESWFPDVGGQQRYMVADSAPIRDSRGDLVAAIQTLHDFTAWKLAEQVISKENERVIKDLQLANIVQSSLFPRKLPTLSGVAVAASSWPAKEIGGDYCDLFVTKDQRLGIGIGDVMGKGIPAALFGTMAYAFVRNDAGQAKSPSELLNRLNRDMFHQLEFSGQFMTFFYGVYDSATGELRYSNAGQNKPVVFRARSGECETLDTKNFYLGGRHDASYKEGYTYLFPGDIVLFYTDGLIEGKNSAKEEFGIERFTAVLKEYSVVDPASIGEMITSEFMEFMSDETPSDDVTFIVLKVNYVS